MKRKVLMICKKDTLTTPPSESKKYDVAGYNQISRKIYLHSKRF